MWGIFVSRRKHRRRAGADNLGNQCFDLQRGNGDQHCFHPPHRHITVGVGSVSQVVWITQPGSAAAGAPFGTQPALMTADSGGNLSTVGLAPTNLVVVSQLAGSGLVGAPLTLER